jgi:glycosyltransferase involved in cell wall biosynthesis
VIPQRENADSVGTASSACPAQAVPLRSVNGAAEQEVPLQVGLLTGGDDKPYALGLASALVSQGIFIDFIGSDAVDGPELHNTPLVNFLNLRGDQRQQVALWRKVVRILAYYGRLMHYAAVCRRPILHILWNNKFELVDRIGLMLYYKLLGKKVVLTAHNVNAAKRDGRDNLLNRISLGFQYRMADHIFVHTKKMKGELAHDFGVSERNVSVIPFGINNTLPRSTMTPAEAKGRLGMSPGERTALFFGQIAPYKGLEYLVAAMAELARRNREPRLIIAGKVKHGCAGYWEKIQARIVQGGIQKRVIEHIKFIPDQEVEVYFKAADVVVVPYTHIFQSGVPFLAYSFGLPVLATDVGSLREDIVEGKTGFICAPRNPADLATKIDAYFSSELYRDLENRRQEIQDFANRKYSWTKVGEITRDVYRGLLTRK